MRLPRRREKGKHRLPLARYLADHGGRTIIQIQLTQDKVATIDDEDYDKISPYTWHAARNKERWYAQTMIRFEDGKRRKVGMHNIITGSKYVDHADNDGLNNTRVNLRPCTHLQNMQNKVKFKLNKYGVQCSSKYKGVSWDKSSGKWMVQIGCDNERIVFRCKDEMLAAKIYNVLAEHFYGEFAHLNEHIPTSQVYGRSPVGKALEVFKSLNDIGFIR